MTEEKKFEHAEKRLEQREAGKHSRFHILKTQKASVVPGWKFLSKLICFSFSNVADRPFVVETQSANDSTEHILSLDTSQLAQIDNPVGYSM